MGDVLVPGRLSRKSRSQSSHKLELMPKSSKGGTRGGGLEGLAGEGELGVSVDSLSCPKLSNSFNSFNSVRSTNLKLSHFSS